jgi:hypothetical protein
MSDPTEADRRALVARLNALPGERAELEAAYGQVWDTEELRAAFEVHSFLAPFVLVTRRSDGARGTLAFQHAPRFYFDFTEAS